MVLFFHTEGSSSDRSVIGNVESNLSQANFYLQGPFSPFIIIDCCIHYDKLSELKNYLRFYT